MIWTSVGTVTSVALTVPTFLSVSGSPITSSGTLAVTLSGTALPVLNGGTGSTTSTGSGSVVLANTPTLITPVIGAATGTSVSVTGNINSLTHTITGSSSGIITIQAQAAAGTYNFNLPITAGTSGQVLTSQGGVSTAMIWTTPSTSNLARYYISDQKTSGTNGGTATSGSWFTRTLNTSTVYPNSDTRVTLAANVMTFAAGSYLIVGTAPGENVGNFTTRLFNNTSSTVLAFGVNSSSAGAAPYGISSVTYLATFAGSTNVILQMQVQTTASSTGQGTPTGFQTEVYSTVTIEVLA